MKRVLFVFTHNSARSQMAEGLLNHRHGGRYEAWSAGTDPRGVHPMAVEVPEEIGIDISHHTSKSVEEVVKRIGVDISGTKAENKYSGVPLDIVITVCYDAKENCPFVPARKGECLRRIRRSLYRRRNRRGEANGLSPHSRRADRVDRPGVWRARCRITSKEFPTLRYGPGPPVRMRSSTGDRRRHAGPRGLRICRNGRLDSRPRSP